MEMAWQDGRRDDALGAGELHAGLEGGDLRHRHRLDQAFVQQLRHQRRIAVVAQAAGVDAGRHEVVAQRVHLHQRRVAGDVAVVVGVDALGQRRAGGRLDRHAAQVRSALVAGRLVGEEGEGDAAEAGTAAAGAEDHVRVEADLVELLLGFEADHGLVQQHVIQHRAQRVVGVGIGGGFLDGFGNGDAERALAVGILRPARSRPALVRLLGLAKTSAPQVCIIERR